MVCTSYRTHKNSSQSVFTRKSVDRAYEFLQVITSDVRLDTDNVPQHSGHRVFSEYHEFLVEKLDTTRVCRKIHFGKLGLQPGNEGGQYRPSRKYRIYRDIKRSGNENKICSARDQWVGGYQISQCFKVFCIDNFEVRKDKLR